MANRDYPLAPTYFGGGDDGKQKPKKTTTRDVTDEEKAVISRSHNTLAKIQSIKKANKYDPRLGELEKLSKRQQDSVNYIGQNLTNFPSQKEAEKNRNNQYYRNARLAKMQKAVDEITKKK